MKPKVSEIRAIAQALNEGYSELSQDDREALEDAAGAAVLAHYKWLSEQLLYIVVLDGFAVGPFTTIGLAEKWVKNNKVEAAVRLPLKMEEM